MSAAGVVAALSAEAGTLGARVRRSDGLYTVEGMLLAVSGMGMCAATTAADRLVNAGAAGLVSWGLAGGLDPALRAGTICLPGAVISREGRSLATSHHWRERLFAAIGAGRRVTGGRLLTSASAINDIAGKAAAFRDTGAVAVDMESLAIATVAAAHQLPFLAVRVIVDTASDALPRAVLMASADGAVQISRLIAGVVQRPVDLGSLIRLASRYRTAKRALVAVARTGALAPLHNAAASTVRVA